MTSSPHIHIIVAMTKDRLIGSKGSLPWHLPEDLAIFRRLTMGNTVIMGRRTFESIGEPLDGRRSIVITSQTLDEDSIETCRSFEAGLNYAVKFGADIFCIGGRAIFRAALPTADWLHVSWVEGDYEGDTWFPEFDLDLWTEIERSRHAGFTHVTYRRKK